MRKSPQLSEYHTVLLMSQRTDTLNASSKLLHFLTPVSLSELVKDLVAEIFMLSHLTEFLDCILRDYWREVFFVHER